MNEVIESAAASEGVYYLDIEDSLSGGRLCEGLTHDYVTGLRNQLWLLTLRSDQRAYLYHPNASGHQKIAEKIYSGLPREFITNSNPAPFPKNPQASDYFKSASLNDKRIVHKQFLSTSFVARGQTVQSRFEPGTFGKTATTVTMYSTPRLLGVQQPANDGALQAEITIPWDVPVGYHTVVFSGVDSAGRTVEFAQSIFVISQNPKDIDDDNIIDDKDNCYFWASCGEQSLAIEDEVNDEKSNQLPHLSNQEKDDLDPDRDERLLSYTTQQSGSDIDQSAGSTVVDGEGVLAAKRDVSNDTSSKDLLPILYGISASTILLVLVIGLIIKLKKG